MPDVPWRVLWLFAREILPDLWEALVRGRSPDEIRLTDARNEMALRQFQMHAREERARREIAARRRRAGLDPP